MRSTTCFGFSKVLSILGLCALTAVWIAACSGGSSPTDPGGGVPPVAPGSSSDSGDSGNSGGSGSGTLTINMVDEPVDEICQLWVYIRDIRVKPHGESQQLIDLTGLTERLWEILQLRDGPPALLGNFSVEQDRYQFIEILLDESQSFVVEKEDPEDPENLNCLTTQSQLQIPSEKIKVNGGPFDVDDSTVVTIDFDARKSLKRKGGNSNSKGNDKGWQLKPVVSIVNVTP